MMASDKGAVTLESLFDDSSVAVDKSFFKDAVVQKMQSSGLQVMEIAPDEAGFTAKVIDPQVSAGYNIFKSNQEYQDWVRAALYEPSESEIRGALDGNGS